MNDYLEGIAKAICLADCEIAGVDQSKAEAFWNRRYSTRAERNREKYRRIARVAAEAARLSGCKEAVRAMCEYPEYAPRNKGISQALFEERSRVYWRKVLRDAEDATIGKEKP